MRIQIRLAERQGLLTGRGLSSLQVAAIYFREIEDLVNAREENTNQFKYALLSTGHIDFDVLFPEIAGSSSTDQVSDADGFADEVEQVTYKFAEMPEMTPQEIEAELAALMGGGNMTVNGGEFSGG